MYKDFELATSTNLTEYLKKLNDDRYTVVISAKDKAGAYISSQADQALQELGLESISREDKNLSYLAVIDCGKVVANELRSDDSVSYSGSIRNGIIRLKVSSSGYSGEKGTISFDGKESSKNRSGLNIVVYSNERRCVVDSVNFDTSDPEVPCVR